MNRNEVEWRLKGEEEKKRRDEVRESQEWKWWLERKELQIEKEQGKVEEEEGANIAEDFIS